MSTTLRGTADDAAEDGPTAPEEAARPARERVYDLLTDAILRGCYASGEVLQEDVVCRDAGVSRTPVREAFRRLEAERFIELIPRKGARVRPVTAREMLELYETRRLIEGFAIDGICSGGRPLPPALGELAAWMRALCDRDLHAHVEHDRLFHRTLVASTQNEILTEAYDGLRSRQQQVALAALRADPMRLPVILDEHERLVEALAARDGPRARGILAAHLAPVGHVVARLG